MNVIEAVAKRRAIRRFKDKPVPYAALEKCAEAARLAPSGRNQQTCEYVLINSPDVLPGIFENIGGSVKLPPDKGGPGPSQQPKAYIIVLINKAVEGDANRRRVTYYDVGMAAQNIMLEAVEQGLGSCPVLMFNEANIKPVLNIPDTHDIALVIVMGFPDESPAADAVVDGNTTVTVDAKGVRHVPKRTLADIVHRNGF